MAAGLICSAWQTVAVADNGAALPPEHCFPDVAKASVSSLITEASMATGVGRPLAFSLCCMCMCSKCLVGAMRCCSTSQVRSAVALCSCKPSSGTIRQSAAAPHMLEHCPSHSVLQFDAAAAGQHDTVQSLHCCSLSLPWALRGWAWAEAWGGLAPGKLGAQHQQIPHSSGRPGSTRRGSSKSGGGENSQAQAQGMKPGRGLTCWGKSGARSLDTTPVPFLTTSLRGRCQATRLANCQGRAAVTPCFLLWVLPLRPLPCQGQAGLRANWTPTMPGLES